MDLCSYGCGKEALYTYKNGKKCCSSHFNKCEIYSSRLSLRNKRNVGRKTPWSKESLEKYRERLKNKNTKGKLLLEKKNQKEGQIISGQAICSYGCGELAKYYFWQTDKFCCSRYWNQCEKVKKDKKVSFKLNKNEDTDIKCCGCGKPAKYIAKISNNYWCEETPQKCPEIRRKNSESNVISALKKFQDPVYLEKYYKGKAAHPNRLEILMDEQILKSKGFNFTGDFSFWIDGKNPDFVNEDKKLVVELFGSYWHGEKFRSKYNNDNKTNYVHEIDIIQHYLKNGYKCLIIWEEEVKNILEVENKINNFLKGE